MLYRRKIIFRMYKSYFVPQILVIKQLFHFELYELQFYTTIFMNIKNKNQKPLLTMNSKFILRYIEEC